MRHWMQIADDEPSAPAEGIGLPPLISTWNESTNDGFDIVF